MFTFVKLLEPFLLPSSFIAMSIIACFIALPVQGRAKKIKIIGLTVLAMYYLFSTWPLTNLMISTLEERFPPLEKGLNPSEIEAIVILSGGADVLGPSLPPELSGASWRRLWQGVKLYYQFDEKIPVLYSGGSGNPFESVSGEAGTVRQIAGRFGIPGDSIWIENVSRDTYENALAVKMILDQRYPSKKVHRVVLVTSAWHLPRAVGVFKKIGLEVVPEPCDYRARMTKLGVRELVPSYEAMSTSSVAIREWIGIAGYRIRGRI